MTAKRYVRSHVPSDRGDTSPRGLSVLALEAMARYTESGLVKPEEHMHEDMAVRLARVARKNRW